MRTNIYIKITLIASALSMCLLSGCSKDKTPDEYIISSQIFIENKDYRAAILELKNAVRMEPKNAQVRLLLGTLYFNQGLLDDADKELNKAKELGAPLGELVPVLARTYWALENYHDVIGLETKDKGLTIEQQNEYFAFKTLAAIKLGDSTLAKASLDKTTETLANSSYTSLAKAFMFMAEGDQRRAVKSINEALKINPALAEAVLFMGKISLAGSDFDLAVTSFEKYLELRPKIMITHLYLANAYLKDKQFENAEKHSDIILKVNERHAFANYIKSHIKFQSGDYTNARRFAEKAIQNKFDNNASRIISGVSAYRMKNYEQAYSSLKTIEESLPSLHLVRKLLAVIELKFGYAGRVLDSLGDIDEIKEADTDFLSIASMQLIKVGRADEAKEILGKLDKASPLNATQKVRSGLIKLIMNDATGLEDLQQAIELDPDFVEAELAYAISAYNQGEPEKTMEVALKWQKSFPEKAEGFNLQAMVHMGKQEFELAREALKHGFQAEADNFAGLIYLANLESGSGNNDLAIKIVEKALMQDPENIIALTSLFRFSLSEDSANVINKIYQKHSNELNYSLLMAKVRMHQQAFSTAATVLSNVPDDERTASSYWRLLFAAYLYDGKNAEAEQALAKWTQISIFDVGSVVASIGYFERKKDFTKALKIIELAIERRPSVEQFQYIKIQILLNAKQINHARSDLSKIPKNESNASVLAGFEGQVLLGEGKYNDALPLLESFYNNDISSESARLLAIALTASDKQQMAITHLNNHLTKNPDDNLSRAMVASFLMKGDSTKAQNEYEILVEKGQGNFVVLNNLAWLSYKSANKEKALKYSKAALDKAPDHINILDTRAMIIFKWGNKEEALSLLSKSYLLSKGLQVGIALHYVEVLIANNNKTEARNILTNISTHSAKFNEKKLQLNKLL